MTSDPPDYNTTHRQRAAGFGLGCLFGLLLWVFYEVGVAAIIDALARLGLGEGVANIAAVIVAFAVLAHVAARGFGATSAFDLACPRGTWRRRIALVLLAAGLFLVLVAPAQP